MATEQTERDLSGLSADGQLTPLDAERLDAGILAPDGRLFPKPSEPFITYRDDAKTFWGVRIGGTHIDGVFIQYAHGFREMYERTVADPQLVISREEWWQMTTRNRRGLTYDAIKVDQSMKYLRRAIPRDWSIDTITELENPDSKGFRLHIGTILPERHTFEETSTPALDRSDRFQAISQENLDAHRQERTRRLALSLYDRFTSDREGTVDFDVLATQISPDMPLEAARQVLGVSLPDAVPIVTQRFTIELDVGANGRVGVRLKEREGWVSLATVDDEADSDGLILDAKVHNDNQESADQTAPHEQLAALVWPGVEREIVEQLVAIYATDETGVMPTRVMLALAAPGSAMKDAFGIVNERLIRIRTALGPDWDVTLTREGYQLVDVAKRAEESRAAALAKRLHRGGRAETRPGSEGSDSVRETPTQTVYKAPEPLLMTIPGTDFTIDVNRYGPNVARVAELFGAAESGRVAESAIRELFIQAGIAEELIDPLIAQFINQSRSQQVAVTPIIENEEVFYTMTRLERPATTHRSTEQADDSLEQTIRGIKDEIRRALLPSQTFRTQEDRDVAERRANEILSAISFRAAQDLTDDVRRHMEEGRRTLARHALADIPILDRLQGAFPANVINPTDRPNDWDLFTYAFYKEGLQGLWTRERLPSRDPQALDRETLATVRYLRNFSITPDSIIAAMTPEDIGE